MKISKSGQITIIAIGATIWLYAFASNRKVSIPADSSGIKIFNGWTAAVTYNAVCFDTAGAEVSTVSANLGAKQAAYLTTGSTPLCADGSAMDTSTAFSNGMAGCGPYTTYSSALSNCPSGYAACTSAQYVANLNGASTDAFIGAGTGFSGNWSYSTDAGSNWSDTTGNLQATYYASDRCASAISGGGSVITQCTLDTGGINMMLCCPTAGSASSCTVEVIGTDGYLQSPQFKSNTPF